MPISANQFLLALDLPSKHPYIQSAHNDDTVVDGEAEKKWSISSYFSSVAWDKDISAETFDECEDNYMSVWPLTVKDGTGGASSNATMANNMIANNITPDFWHEVKPCLIAMVHLNILLWAPFILLLCLRKIYLVQHKHVAKNEDATPPLLQFETSCSSDSCSSMQTMLSLSSSQIKNTGGPLVAMPTFSGCLPAMSALPSLRNKTTITAHNKQDRQPAETYSFERLLLLLSLFVSALASYKAVFSVVEDEKEKNKDEPNSGQFKERKRSDSNVSLSQGPFVITTEWLAYLVALVLTAILANDSMYTMEFGQRALLALHLFVITVSLKRFGTKISLATCIPITAIALYIMVNSDLDLPTIEPGLYHDERNKYISNIVKEWPIDKRTYDDGRGTPWMLTGDVRTGLPFMVNNIPEQKYVRRWIPLPDNEAVILDVAFPDNMKIEDGKRVYLVLHGINGNSNEGYVVDFVRNQVSQGNVVAVMVSRGLGDSQVLGDDILHFARVSDVGLAARALRNAINRVGTHDERRLLLAGVGYSMGGITLANYVSQANPPDLDAAIVFSAALDTKEQVNFQRSASLWQPFIAKAMRDNILSRFSRQIHKKFDENQMKKVMRASTMVELDRDLFVPYHGFESLEYYYSRMGAMGDFDINGYEGRMRNVSIPLLCVQALDDPVGYWKTFHNPKKVAKGNTILLFTQTGGHVGWPLSVNPSRFGWSWMSDVASSFAESVDLVRNPPC